MALRESRDRRDETEQALGSATPAVLEDHTTFVGHGVIPPVAVDAGGATGPTASDRAFGSHFVADYERYQQLHDLSYQVAPVTPYPLPPIAAPAGASVLSPADQQENREYLVGAAMNHPYAGELQQMGVTPAELPATVGSIRNYDQFQRTTSIPGADHRELPMLEYTTAATTAVARGETTLPAAPAGDERVAERAKVLGEAAAMEPYQNQRLGMMLEMLATRMSLFVSDSPTTLLDHEAPMRDAVVALVQGRTQWLRAWTADVRSGTPPDRAGHAFIMLQQYAGSVSTTNELAMLRELAAYDGPLARELGTAYIEALREAIAAVHVSPLSHQV